MSPLTCAQCNSMRLFKNGFRKLRTGEKVQTYICRECGYRFTDPRLLQVSSERRFLKSNGIFAGNQICAQEAKNLEPRTETRNFAGEISQADIRGKIVEFSFWQLKQGYSKITIEMRVKLLRRLMNLGANLNDEDSVKGIIALQQWSTSRKVNAVDAFDSWLKMQGKKWTPPIYKRVRKLPFIPTETEIDQLIAGTSKRISTYLQLLKETGMRCGEASQLKWIDFDFENRAVRVTPEKGSNPRILPISTKLIDMLNSLNKDAATVFRVDSNLMRRNYSKQRRPLAAKLKNPRLLQVTFHTFRHWKATMEYHKTRDILHVKEILGHRSLDNTMKYTQLISFKNDEFSVRIAHTEEEACQLLENGYDFVCDYEANKLFRKRK